MATQPRHRAQRLEAVERERDALVEELRTTYAEHARAIADLLARIQANDARIDQMMRAGAGGLASADATARGLCHHETDNAVPLVRAVRLPTINRNDVLYGRGIWLR